MAKKKTTPKKQAAKAKKPAPKKTQKRQLAPKSKEVNRRSAAGDTASLGKAVVPSRAFPIVGLGASAGGLEALEEFFEHMPADSGMAFVVVMHQAAKHVSLLPELLAKHTKMHVAPIHDRMTVQQDHVYVVPPGKNVDLA